MLLFSSTHEFQLPISKEEFKNRLLGKHVKIHNLDFEVMEYDYRINIVPHAEQVTDIKTLPITEIEFKDESGKTKVVIKSKMRKLDAGGPQLIMIFCAFLFVASILLFYSSGKEVTNSAVVLGVCLLIFGTFLFRMQTGYYDYVRKIRQYVETKGA